MAEKFVEFDYFTDGQFQTLSRYADLAGTQFVAGSTYGYDGNGRLTGLTHAKATNTLADYDWIYDKAHRITQFDSSVDGATTYDYDNLDQLTGENHPGSPDDHTYAYDGTGNREDVDGTTWSSGDANRLTDDGTFTYQYDAEGNLTKRTRKSGASADDYVTEYEWDHRNRLTQVTFKNNSLVVTKTVSYNCDYLNRRVHREVGSDDSYYVYDGTDVVLEFDGAEGDDVSHRYLHGPAVDQVLAGEAVSSLDAPGDVLWSLSDNLGTVRDLVEYNAGTDTATVANHLEYDAYGNIISETNAAVDFLYAFTGREWDAETQLQNNLNRWYDPKIGRWLSEDPIGFEAGDSNLYRYVGNAPTIGTDPDGLEQRAGSGGFWDSVSNSWRGMQDTYTSLIVTYWYGLPNEGTRIMEDAYNRGPLGQSKDAPGWCYYGTRGSLGVATTATAAAAAVGATEVVVLGNQSVAEINVLSQGNVFKVISRPVKCGIRVDPAHHGKPWGHPHWWRW